MNSSRVSKFGLRPTLVSRWTQSRLAHRRDFVFAGVTIARRVWVAISHLGDGRAVGPTIPGRGTVLGRAVTQCKPIQVSDVEADPEYTLEKARGLGDFRTSLVSR